MINQLNCFSALLMNLVSLNNFILREHIFRRHLSIISFAVTRKNKLRKKRLMKKMQLLRRKPKSVWVVNFRLSRESFFSLHEQLPPYIATDPKTPNYMCLSSEKKLALTLYYLKDTGSLWMTANAFGVHQCTASKIVILVCNAINKHLGPAYLHLPQDKDEMIRKVSKFELKFGMIQEFGYIDGTYIPLKTPMINSQDHFNYKQFYLINVQAVCDCRGLFMDIYCRWPGSVHDAKVFANSKINEKLKNGLLPTFSCPVQGKKKYQAIC